MDTAFLDLAVEYVLREGTFDGGRGTGRRDNHEPGSDRHYSIAFKDIYAYFGKKLYLEIEETIQQKAYGEQSVMHSYLLVRKLTVEEGDEIILQAERNYGGIGIQSSFFDSRTSHIEPGDWSIKIRTKTLDEILALIAGEMSSPARKSNI